jgi:hypothetical protein
MSSERTEAAVLQLKSKALEVYGIIKGIYTRPPEPGDVDRVVALSLKLVQYEGAMLTLKEYFGDKHISPPASRQTPLTEEQLAEKAKMMVQRAAARAAAAISKKKAQEETAPSKKEKVASKKDPTTKRATRKKKGEQGE